MNSHQRRVARRKKERSEDGISYHFKPTSYCQAIFDDPGGPNIAYDYIDKVYKYSKNVKNYAEQGKL